MAKRSYTDTDSVKIYLGGDLTDTESDNPLIADLIYKATSIIEGSTSRIFLCSTDSTRTFDALSDIDGHTIWLDEDLCAITTVTNGDGVVVTPSQYVTEPRNRTPYYSLRLKSSAGIFWTYLNDPENAISITGRWAYSITPPEDIVHACIRLSSFLYRQRDNQMDLDRVVRTPDGSMLMPSRLPQDIQEILATYRKVV